MATRRALPLSQWLALEDDVARHKAEIAQAFAEARERLLPPDPPQRPQPTQADYWRGVMLNAQQAAAFYGAQAAYQNKLVPGGVYPVSNDLWAALTGSRLW